MTPLEQYEYDKIKAHYAPHKVRGFEVVSVYASVNPTLPARATQGSCGYDIRVSSSERIVIPAGTMYVLSTGIKAYMQPDEYLALYIRSSVGTKRHLMLATGVSAIDSDYYNNPDNEGHIMIPLTNIGETAVIIEPNERIAQGVFHKYLLADDDNTTGIRTGGTGSTGAIQ